MRNRIQYTDEEVVRLENEEQHWTLDEPDVAELLTKREQLLANALDFEVGEDMGSFFFHANDGSGVQMHTAHLDFDVEDTGAGQRSGEHDHRMSLGRDDWNQPSPRASPSQAALQEPALVPILVAPVVENPQPVAVVEPPPPRRTGRIRKQVVRLGQVPPPTAVIVADPQPAPVPLPLAAPVVPAQAPELELDIGPEERRMSGRKRKQAVMFIPAPNPRKRQAQPKPAILGAALEPQTPKKRVRSQALATRAIKDRRPAVKSTRSQKKKGGT